MVTKASSASPALDHSVLRSPSNAFAPDHDSLNSLLTSMTVAPSATLVPCSAAASSVEVPSPGGSVNVSNSLWYRVPSAADPCSR